MSVALTIDSTNREDSVIWNTLKRDNRMNTDPDTLRFAIKYGGSKTYIPQMGDEVILTVNGIKEFGGVIARVQQRLNSFKQIRYDVTCRDYVFELDGEIITQRYESKTIQFIVEDIISTYTTGFTYANVVASGINVDSMAFNRLTVSQALAKLARLTAYSWYVDYDKDVHFFARTQEAAPFNLSDTTDDQSNDYARYIYNSLVFKEDITQIRNDIIVQGGEKEGNSRSVTYLGSQISTEGILNLGYKFSSLPVVTVNAVPVSVGIDFIDSDAAFVAMWDFNQKYVRFTSGNIPISTDTIIVTGTPLYPIIVSAKDTNSIAQYGTKQFSIKDVTIRSDDEAIERALAELQAYADQITDGKFQTYEPGLRAGQLINISDTYRGISEDVLIQQVGMKSTDPNGDKLTFEVKFATLRTIGILEFLQRQLLDEEILADEEEVLLTFLQILDTANFTDSLATPTTLTGPYKWSNDAETTPGLGQWNFATWS